MALGSDPISVSVLLARAEHEPAFAEALGDPPPSCRSLGRLLAHRAGVCCGELELERCPGRIDNSAVWRLRRSVGRGLGSRAEGQDEAQRIW